jgi:hypothetical protein
MSGRSTGILLARLSGSSTCTSMIYGMWLTPSPLLRVRPPRSSCIGWATPRRRQP